MNKLSTAKRAQIVAMMTEGNSLRAITRMTGASINTVTNLLVELGTACATFHDEHVRNVKAKRVEADEVWTFCYARRDNVPEDKKGELGYGDVWTWVGLDPDSKLVLSWTVGRRDANTGYEFMHDLADRLANRVQLTTDGLHADV
jgi:lambda repressor-like predicted transcriptional regulator